MIKQILFFILLSTAGLAQSDSLLQKEIIIDYATQVIPSSGITYTVYRSELSLKKLNWVMIPSFSMKKLHGLDGFQGGVDVYKKWDKGYGHASLHYSPQSIFPRYLVKGNVFRKLKKSFELQLGMNGIFFSENSLYSINGGLSFYRKKYMFNYSAQYYIESNISQRVLVRKYLRKSQDFIQFGYFFGIQEDLIIGQNNPINVHTFQCGLHKTIYQKTQIQFSVATLAISKVDRKEQYFTYRIALKRRL